MGNRRTESYLKFVGPNWETINDFEEELIGYPISCLDNIAVIAGTNEELREEMCNMLQNELITSFENERDFKLKEKIALGLCCLKPQLPHLITVFGNSDFSDEKRNEFLKEIIDRWRHNDHKRIDLNNLRHCLKANLEHFNDKRSDSILQSLFR